MPLPSQVHIPSTEEKDFTIVQRDGKWCLISKSTGQNLGCHDSEEDAMEQEKAVLANKSKESNIIELTSEQVFKSCRPCAEKMKQGGISKLKLDISKMNLGIEDIDETALIGLREAALRVFDLSETHNIQGVEIFSVGKWNGETYAQGDIEAIAASFQDTKKYLKPYLKIGHGDTQSLLRADELPAAGYVSEIYVKGDKLIADFERMPAKIFELVKARAYDKLSCEIYVDIKVNGKKYPYALKAIALLGGETPAVENLESIRALYALDNEVLAYGKDNSVRAHQFGKDQEEGAMPANECEDVKKELEEYKKKALSLEADLKKFSEEKAALESKIAAFEKENVDLKTSKDEIEKKFSEATEALAKVESEKRIAEVETRVNGLVTGKKILPAQAPMLKAILLHAKDSGVKKFSLSEKENFDSEEQLILAFVEKGSETGLPTEEKSESGKSSKLDKSNRAAFAKAVEKYAAEHKVSYSEAYKLLDAKPELAQ